MALSTFLWLIPLPPLAAFAVIALLTFRRNGLSHTIAVGAAAISWLLSMVVTGWAFASPNLAEAPVVSAINWLPLGDRWLQIGVLLDPLAAVTLFFVAWTVLMIFIYSIGYHNYGQPLGDHDHPGLPPHGASIRSEQGHAHRAPSIEPLYARFFAFISLFAFGMFALVVTDNLLILYLAWEIMGLCSYLLIGFWYARPSARDAAVKAFLTTRVGDMFMLLGMVALYSQTGTLNYRAILADEAVLNQLVGAVSPVLGLSWAGLIGLLIFAGTVGKSAQFPLHVWLPDAMEGPTPVSAMIHAATMVSAGVYLSARFFPLLSAGWAAGEPLTVPMQVMAAVGAFTALFAATIAVAQNDVKRVLAYSTISQLGYMVAALGVGAYAAAVFHLVTHAFFKALLFLGSGSVIHGMEHGLFHSGEKGLDPQDMRNMGGLASRMPVTFWTFVAGGLALSGFPLITAGFWSKDAILAGAFNDGRMVVFIVLALAALLTAFYTARQITLTFLGRPRSEAAAHATESGPTMVIPLVVLAVFAVAAGWAGIPADFPGLGGIVPDWIAVFLESGSAGHGSEAAEAAHSLMPLVTSILVSLGGLALGWLVYKGYQAGARDPLQKTLGAGYRLLQNRYYIDQLYSRTLERGSGWLAETFTSRWIDRGFLDGILHGIGKLGMVVGQFLRNYIDLPVWNGIGDVVSDRTRGLGGSLRVIQTGRIQQYMIATVLVLFIVGIIAFFLIGI